VTGVDKSGLDPRRLLALEDLFLGVLKDEEIADKHNISRACLSKWKKDPAWIDEWNERIAAIQSHARQRLLSKTANAVDVVEEVLNNPDAQDKDRLKAAEMLLKLAGMEPATKVDVSGKLETTTPDAVALEARLAENAARLAELEAELAGGGD